MSRTKHLKMLDPRDANSALQFKKISICIHISISVNLLQNTSKCYIQTLCYGLSLAEIYLLSDYLKIW